MSNDDGGETIKVELQRKTLDDGLLRWALAFDGLTLIYGTVVVYLLIIMPLSQLELGSVRALAVLPHIMDSSKVVAFGVSLLGMSMCCFVPTEYGPRPQAIIAVFLVILFVLLSALGTAAANVYYDSVADKSPVPLTLGRDTAVKWPFPSTAASIAWRLLANGVALSVGFLWLSFHNRVASWARREVFAHLIKWFSIGCLIAYLGKVFVHLMTIQKLEHAWRALDFFANPLQADSNASVFARFGILLIEIVLLLGYVCIVQGTRKTIESYVGRENLKHERATLYAKMFGDWICGTGKNK